MIVCRLGITKHDPARNLSEELPPNICPYLQNVSGYWVGVLPEGFSKTSNQIALYLNQRGRYTDFFHCRPIRVLFNWTSTLGLFSLFWYQLKMT